MEKGLKLFFWILVVVGYVEVLSALAASYNHDSDYRTEQTKSYDKIIQERGGLVSTGLVKFLESDHKSEALTAAATIIIAFFTATLWRVSDRQSNDSRILNRAYLAVEPCDIEEYTLGDDRMACDVVFKNTGSLPATKINWFVTSDIDRSADRREFPLDDKTEVGNITLAPRAKMRKGVTDEPAMTKAEFLRNRAVFHNQPPDPEGGRGWLFVWGVVTYNDGFQDGRRTEFCIRYSMAKATETPAGIAAKEARYHEHGNRTDAG